MTKQTEALKLALEALEGAEALLLSMGLTHLIVYGDAEKAITAIREALADQPAQNPGRNHWEDGDVFERIAAMKKQPAQQYNVTSDPQLMEMPKIGCVNHDCDKCKAQQQEPVAWADKCRIELVTAIHFLASDFENALGAFGGDIEARRKAEGDIAYARIVASRWNWNEITQPAQHRHISYVCPQCHWSLDEQPAQQQCKFPLCQNEEYQQALAEQIKQDLYTGHPASKPASKPWVGLTDEEMRDLEKQFNAERVRTSDEEYLIIYPSSYWSWMRAIEAKLREKNAQPAHHTEQHLEMVAQPNQSQSSVKPLPDFSPIFSGIKGDA